MWSSSKTWRSCITLCFKDEKQSHLGGVLIKIQGTIASRKKSWAGDLSTTHRNKELFAIPSLSDLHRTKTSEVVGVFARIFLFGPGTYFIRYLHDYMCKLNWTETTTQVFQKKSGTFFLSLILAGDFLLISLQTELFGSYYVIISVFVKSVKMTSFTNLFKTTDIVMSNRAVLFQEFLLHRTVILFGLMTVWLRCPHMAELASRTLLLLISGSIPWSEWKPMKADINRNLIWLRYPVNNRKISLLGIGNFLVLLSFCNNENSVSTTIESVQMKSNKWFNKMSVNCIHTTNHSCRID